MTIKMQTLDVIISAVVKIDQQTLPPSSWVKDEMNLPIRVEEANNDVK